MNKKDKNHKYKQFVSIITPTYNRADLLNKLIESVCCQIFQDWELIIVDDRSTDDTAAVVKKYQKKDSRVKYFINLRSKGPAGARNCGIMRARGNFIAFLDSDDEWDENYLEDSIKALQAEDTDICLSLFYRERNGAIEKKYEGIARKMITQLSPFKKEKAFYFFNKNICDFMVKNWAFFYHLNAMVIRKRAISVIGMFNEKLWGTEDFEFVFRALLHYDRFCLLNNYYYINHQSEDSLVNFDRGYFCDAKVINRLAIHKQYEIKMLKTMQGEIKKSKTTLDKKECTNKIKQHIGQEYYYLGSLVRRVNLIRALRYIMISLTYGCNRLKIKQLALFLKPGYRQK